jgi:hypothetical protein
VRVRGTQSLLYLCADCWKRPSLLGWELLWRWGFGIPAALFTAYQLWPIGRNLFLSLADFSFSDPVQAGQQIASLAASFQPAVEHLALWLVPLLAMLWAVASGLGRSAVLRILAPTAQPNRVTLILLQAFRILALLAAFVSWYRALQWAANVTLDERSPNVVGWCAFVICLSLAFFVVWALVSWIFSVAPLLAVLEGKGVLASLGRSLRLGPMTGKLVEVNLVLGIVRLALIVLAMVFSAIPLPFLTGSGGLPLYLWWLLGTVLYLVAGDFFQVVRLAAFVHFWRFYQDPLSVNPTSIKP